MLTFNGDGCINEVFHLEVNLNKLEFVFVSFEQKIKAKT